LRVFIAATFFLAAASRCWAQQTGSMDEYHRGYLWAHMHNVDNTSACAGISDSFSDGCAAFIAEQRTVMAGDGKSAASPSAKSALGSSLRDRQRACVVSVRLEQASNQLALCARSLDSNDDCGSKYRDVRDAFDDYSGAALTSREACK
jgi:hypothetical protein